MANMSLKHSYCHSEIMTHDDIYIYIYIYYYILYLYTQTHNCNNRQIFGCSPKFIEVPYNLGPSTSWDVCACCEHLALVSLGVI